MSPGSGDEATEMETGAPHPAVMEMGKARFSISTGWERGSSRSSRSRMRLLDLHPEICTALSMLHPGVSLLRISGLPGSRGLGLIFVSHLFGFPEQKRCFE